MGGWSWPWASFSSVPAWPTLECGRTPLSRQHSTRWQTRPRHKLHATCGRRNLFQLSSKVHGGTEALSFSNSSANCFAKNLATNLRREQPVAVPLTPPSGLESAVRRAQVRPPRSPAGPWPGPDWKLLPTIIPQFRLHPEELANVRMCTLLALARNPSKVLRSI